ncbi:MAG: hypothetical protein WD696_08100 [Bryobacteraceae bacterium]
MKSPRPRLPEMPDMHGQPIAIRFLPSLSAHRGKLLSNRGQGMQIHAGSFVHRREIVFDAALASHPGEWNRIFVHECFHFVWVRLGNRRRRSFEEAIAGELRRRARGELGWSAEWRKRALKQQDGVVRSRAWREYVCESFCDTAAWLLAEGGPHEEFTLASRFREARKRWFEDEGLHKRIRV